MDDNAGMFLDRGSDDDTVLRAVSRLSTADAPGTLWTQVANDGSYRPFHRAVAVHELFKRHVVPPMTLRQLASLLDGGRWLVSAVIERIESMGGEIPVRVPAGGSAYVIRLPKTPATGGPEVGVYLALDRAIDAELLRDALMSGATDPSVGEVRIVDLHLYPESLECQG